MLAAITMTLTAKCPTTHHVSPLLPLIVIAGMCLLPLTENVDTPHTEQTSRIYQPSETSVPIQASTAAMTVDYARWVILPAAISLNASSLR